MKEYGQVSLKKPKGSYCKTPQRFAASFESPEGMDDLSKSSSRQMKMVRFS